MLCVPRVLSLCFAFPFVSLSSDCDDAARRRRSVAAGMLNTPSGSLSLSRCFFMLITHTGLGQHPYRSLISHITRISHNASSHISQSPPNTHLVVRRTQSGIHAGLYHYRHPASLLSYTFYPLFPSIPVHPDTLHCRLRRHVAVVATRSHPSFYPPTKTDSPLSS